MGLYPVDGSLFVMLPTSGLFDFIIVELGRVELGLVGVVVEAPVDLVKVFSTLNFCGLYYW